MCIWVYVNVCLCVCIHVCLCECAYVFMWVCVCLCVYMCVFKCVHVYVYTCPFVLVCVCVCGQRSSQSLSILVYRDWTKGHMFEVRTLLYYLAKASAVFTLCLGTGTCLSLRPGHSNFQIDLKAKGLFVAIGVSVLFWFFLIFFSCFGSQKVHFISMQR